MATYYLHTLDGRPATYEPDPWPALIVIQQPSRTFPKAGGTLVRSLRTLRAQQMRCYKALPSRDRHVVRYGHVRVQVP